MPLFIYPVGMADRLLLAINDARRCPSTKVLGVNSEAMRLAVRALSYHDLLLVPGLDHCTPEIERLKLIAHNMGIEVRPLIAHVDKVLHPILDRARNKKKLMGTAAASAASPSQHSAAVASTH